MATAECELGFGAWTRPPRLPVIGRERDEVLKIIREGIRNRPAVPQTAS